MVEEKRGGRATESLAGKKPSRKKRKERTRQLLLDSVIDIALSEGTQAITTTRLMRVAGITQPAFYVYFKNVDDCLQVAAGTVFEGLGQFQAEARQMVGSSLRSAEGIEQTSVVAAACESVLSLALSRPRLMAVALRFHRDTSSVLGQSVRNAMQAAHLQMAGDLRSVASRAPGSDACRPNCDLLADLLIWLLLGALETLLEKRQAERDAVVGLLARAVDSLVVAEIRKAALRR